MAPVVERNFTDHQVPDITYCVNVTNSTSTSTSTSITVLHTECGIEIPGFIYQLADAGPCGDLSFSVTPVDRAGNGTSRSVNHIGAANIPYLQSVDVTDEHVVFTMSATVCFGEVYVDDLHTAEDLMLRDNLTVQETIVIIDRTQLSENRRYYITLYVTNNNVSEPYSASRNISTHDIENAVVTKEATAIIIITDYFDHSSASGALYIFVPLDDNGAADLTRAVYLALDKNTSHNHTLPFSLSGGRMEVFVYDIESDGTLASGVGYPAVNREIVITGTNFQDMQPSFSPLVNCSTTSTGNFIVAKCSYPSSSTAIGFVVIAQPWSEALRIYTNKTMDRHSSASIEVEENGLYQVTIFAIKEGSGMVNSNVDYTEQLLVDNLVAAATTTGATEDSSDKTSVIANATESNDEPNVNAIAIIAGIVGTTTFVVLVMSLLTVIGLVKFRCQQNRLQKKHSICIMYKKDPSGDIYQEGSYHYQGASMEEFALQDTSDVVDVDRETKIVNGALSRLVDSSVSTRLPRLHERRRDGGELEAVSENVSSGSPQHSQESKQPALVNSPVSQHGTDKPLITNQNLVQHTAVDEYTMKERSGHPIEENRQQPTSLVQRGRELSKSGETNLNPVILHHNQ